MSRRGVRIPTSPTRCPLPRPRLRTRGLPPPRRGREAAPVHAEDGGPGGEARRRRRRARVAQRVQRRRDGAENLLHHPDEGAVFQNKHRPLAQRPAAARGAHDHHPLQHRLHLACGREGVVVGEAERLEGRQRRGAQQRRLRAVRRRVATGRLRGAVGGERGNGNRRSRCLALNRRYLA